EGGRRAFVAQGEWAGAQRAGERRQGALAYARCGLVVVSGDGRGIGRCRDRGHEGDARRGGQGLQTVLRIHVHAASRASTLPPRERCNAQRQRRALPDRPRCGGRGQPVTRMTLAKLRLPTCSTPSKPGGNTAPASSTTAPSTFTARSFS